MLTLGGGSGASRIILSGVKNLKGNVIGNSPDERRVQGMMLNVVDDRGVVSERAAWANCLVALGVGGDVPAMPLIRY